jgi:exosome complex exonuclease RRP6
MEEHTIDKHCTMATPTSDPEAATDDAAALSQLMQALAAGARAVQAIPLQDEFSFQRSFPEFTAALTAAQSSLLETATATLSLDALRSVDDYNMADVTDNADIDDPVLWENCADACDLLVEQVEEHLKKTSGDSATGSDNASAIAHLHHWSAEARQRSVSSFGRMLDGVVDMEKPQVTYGIAVHNARDEPFVPAVHPDKPYADTPLDLTLKRGHGLESRFGELRSASAVAASVVAPATHVAHIYEAEIAALEYTHEQVQATEPLVESIVVPAALEAVWVDTLNGLIALAKKLEAVNEVAIDLEAHSYRSFAGILCLMQISCRSNAGAVENYLIDTLKLHAHITEHLTDVFANPSIVKVMHGADSDVQWLQRDFGIYIVNLFDTGRAARVLQFPSAGYAHLLDRYCGIAADKSHQMADWRQRPLPVAMQQYAIQDTHYLLDIYDRLRWELTHHAETSIESVLDTSRQVCLIRYAGEPFKPAGYKMIMSRSRGRKRTDLNARQEGVLGALWEWRDETAREQDESPVYVCPNDALLRIALACPVTLTALQGVLNPMPPLVMRFAQDVMGIVKRVTAAGKRDADTGDDEDDEDKEMARQPVGAPSSAFFKPASLEEHRRSGMLSPVLGTAALYQQAGWMTPQEQSRALDDKMIADVTTTTTDDDDPDENSVTKPRRLLSVHASNKDFRSKQYSGHSLDLGSESASGQARSVDGMGTVRAARESSRSPVPHSVEEEAKAARQSSVLIRSGLSQNKSLPAVMGLVSPTIHMDEEEEGGEERKERDGAEAEEEEEFVIPRSMREIYKISNRNRSNKKAGSPTPERGMTPTTEKEREELARAEALLKERGIAELGYFDENPPSPGKRQRLRSATGRESEESVPQDSSNVASKEDDIAFMEEIGWINNSAEIETIVGRRYGDEAEDQTDGTVQMKGANPHAAAPAYGYDYSSVGPIGAMPAAQSVNPFFTGAAITGGPLAQGAQSAVKPVDFRSKKGIPTSRSKQNRNKQPQERPEKKDGRTHAYRKR